MCLSPLERDTLTQEIESGKSLQSHLAERAEGLTDELNRLQTANAALEEENDGLKAAKQALEVRILKLRDSLNVTSCVFCRASTLVRKAK